MNWHPKDSYLLRKHMTDFMGLPKEQLVSFSTAQDAFDNAIMRSSRGTLPESKLKILMEAQQALGLDEPPVKEVPPTLDDEQGRHDDDAPSMG